MADITVTAANVALVSGGGTLTGTSGVDITAGQSLYKDSTDSNKIKLADADASASAVSVGIALHGSLTGQPITYQNTGSITPGGTVVVGEVYFVSATAGGIAPDADIVTGKYRSLLGIGTTTAVIKLNLDASGVQVP